MIISACETPVKADKFLSFNDKYKGESGKGMKSLKRIILQDGDRLTVEVKKNTEKIYKLFNLKGVIRCDYIIEKDKIYINEINTIPGSLAYYLFTPYNISFTEMLTDCIEYAIKQKEYSDSVITHYDSSLLSKDYKINNYKK
jgi:D-alanine-D-alanine ligase